MKIFKILGTSSPWAARVRFWPSLPLTKKPVEGEDTCKFLYIFSEINIDLSCSGHRVLTWSLWQGLGAQLSWGRYPKIMHWSKVTPWAARYPSSRGNKRQGKDEIHLQTLQHTGLGLGTVKHAEAWIWQEVLPAQDMSTSCPYIYISLGWANQARFQTSINRPASLLKSKWDLPYLRPTNYLTSFRKKKKKEVERCFFSSENPHSNYHHLNGFVGFLFRGFVLCSCLSGFKEEQIFTAQAQTPINQDSSLKHWQTLHWSGVSRGCSTTCF